MKKIIKKVSQAVQLVLMAPIKLPGKAMNILKYIAVGLGIIEKVIDKDREEERPYRAEGKEDENENAE